jgi:ABC-type transporter Mla subunit MlaD
MRAGGGGSLTGSPILIGAVTCLVTVIAVFLSYNANNGLPFVPTYDVTVTVPDAAGLVEGNEVRIGGKRVGLVTHIAARQTPRAGPYALLDVKLDETARPLRLGTRVTVRPRSPLGLKYLEVTPSDRGRVLAENGTLPLRAARPVVDLDEVLNAFDQGTRRSLQLTVAGLGGGLAGRGADLNDTLAQAPPLVRGIDRVSANVADPRTGLHGMLAGLDSAAAEADRSGAALGSIVHGADVTAGALASVRPQLEATIAQLPATEDTGTRALAAARPVLHDARALLRDARPGTRVLASAATRLHGAIGVGIPSVRRALALSDRLRASLGAVDTLARDPLTRDALVRLTATLRLLLPPLRWALPFQTTCNYIGLWTRNVTSSISEGDDSGTWFRTLVVAGADEATAKAKLAPNIHVNPYGNTALAGQEHECEPGNEPYLPGQQVGSPPGNQGAHTEETHQVPGVSGP